MSFSVNHRIAEDFYQAALATSVGITTLIESINTAKGVKGFRDIASGPLAPDRLAATFRKKALPFAVLSAEDLGVNDPLSVLQIREALMDDVLPSLDVAGTDWNSLLRGMSGTLMTLGLQPNAAEVATQIQSIAAALEDSRDNLDRLVIPNAAFVLDDLGIRIE